MRSILLHIANDRCLTPRTEVALDLARAFDAHVTFGQTLPFETIVTGDAFGDLSVNLLPMSLEQAETMRRKIEARLSAEDIAWDWCTMSAAARYAVPELAALADVIVLGACDENHGPGTYSALAADLVIHSRSPILLVPENAPRFDPLAPIAIAWNGSHESCRALKGALPLIAKAGEVHLLTILEERADRAKVLPPISGAEYLSRHGIECQITELPANDAGIANTLAQAALAREASCLVAGAYGRTRLHETILGGVSRSLMNEALLPLFMVH